MNNSCAKCYLESSLYRLYTLQKCGHIFCEKCLYEHVKAIKGYKIKCPLMNCNQSLRDPEIRKFLQTNRIEEYEKSQFPIGIIRKCLTKNCPYICISENDVIFQCEYCEQPNCTKCKMRHNLNECVKNENHEKIRNQLAQEVILRKKRKEIEAYDLERDLVPNFNGFECPICEEFFLPNTQVMLRTCQHEFCLQCLIQTLRIKKSFHQLGCPICNALLTSVEINMLVGIKFVDSLNKSLIQPKVYQCRYPGCDGFWDYDSEKTCDYECPVCRNINCKSCGVVHKNVETCSKYQSTDEYKSFKSAKEDSESKSVICRCGRILIWKGGCGALYCDNCFEHICLFTGLLAGKSLPEGCGCSSTKTCHIKCEYGCISYT